MKKIELQKLLLHSFKGIKDFEIEPNGQSIEVLGQNATGKTTIFDAFTWLLFGKDSHDSQLNPKPLDENGNEALGQEPLVEATLMVDGEELRLHRALKENWVKQRGQLEQTRKSDVTEIYVNDVPKKVTEYQTFINELVDENTFKMLTNPFAFNTLKWQKQREVLMSLVSDLSDEDISKHTKHAEEIKDLLEEHPLDEQRKIIANQMSKIKKDIDGLPARIDEATRAIPDVNNFNRDQLQTQLDAQNEKLQKAENGLVLAEASSGSADYQNKKNQLQSELSSKRVSFASANQMELSSLTNDLNTQQQKVNTLSNEINHMRAESSLKQDSLKRLSDERGKLLKEFHVTDDLTFDQHVLTCPTCGQDYPAEKADEIRDAFNVKRSSKLESIKKQGKEIAAKIKTLKAELQESTNLINEKSSELTSVQNQLNVLNKEYEDKKNSAPKFEDSEIYKQLQQSIVECDQSINNAAGSNQDAISQAEHAVNQIREEKSEIESQLALFKTVEQQHSRIEELEQEDGKLKQQYAELEKSSFILEEFVRTKVNILEKEINKKFKLVSFKLFETQKNGGLKETCEAMVDGVPFDKGLNNAARINAGLDVINTLSNTYQIQAPIFVDNAESVNSLIDTNAQKIALAVSTDQKMKVVA